jgi:serine protease Do
VVNVEVTERSGEVPLALTPWDQGTLEEEGGRPAWGSGFVLDSRGFVVTNHHLVEGALALRVRFLDGRQIPAQLVGADPETDLALLRLVGTLQGLAPLTLGSSDDLNVGDWVLALGNPLGENVTASVGILSAKARTLQRGAYGDFLQTDAAIHPGNSGGPLLGLDGRVVGINTALLGGSTGIGFAIPSSVLRLLLPQLLKRGRVTRGWIGAYVTPLTPELSKRLGVPETAGAAVTECMPGSPAEHGGLQPDDVILRLDGRAVASAEALIRMLSERRPGTTLALSVLRGGRTRTVRLTVGDLPDWEPVPRAGAVPDPLQRFGLLLEPAPEGDDGVRLSFVRSGSLAAEAGLREGAVVHEAGGEAVHRPEELQEALVRAPQGTRLLLRVELPGLPHLRLRALRIP